MCYYLVDVPDNRYRILVNAYFQAWSISRLTPVITVISFLQPISEHLVARSIRLLKTNKVVGLDKISARLLKDSVDVITFSLTNLQINVVNYLHECELQQNA